MAERRSADLASKKDQRSQLSKTISYVYIVHVVQRDPLISSNIRNTMWGNLWGSYGEANRTTSR